MFRIAAGLAVLAVVAATIRFVTMPVSPHYARPEIDFAIPPRAVVWAGLSGGYFYYFLRRQAALISYFSPASQDEMIRTIARDGVPQFIVADWENQVIVARLAQSATLRLAGRAFAHDVYEIVVPPPAR